MKKKTTPFTVKIPANLATSLTRMADEREMSVEKLIVELVEIGVMDLKKNPPALTLTADEPYYALSLRKPG